MIDSAVGCDPGPATGLAFLDYEDGRLVGRSLLQVVGADAPVVLRGMLVAYYSDDFSTGPRVGRRVGSVEKFVTGASAGSRGKNADVTRQLVMELTEVLQEFGYTVAIRPAADVKPWANNKRLVAAGIVSSEKAMHGDMGHSYDGARHCLYGAKEAGIIRDPLIRRTA
ncbi:MAG TPA: hypothetical protein VGG75_13985 [Trebonia sp.]